MKWLSVLAAVVLIICCFQPWILIESRQIVVSGVDAPGTRFGKPGYMHLVWSGLFILLALIPRVWAVRWNLAVVALNLAWALRNFFLLTTCQGGECPEKLPAFYVVVVCCAMMLLGALLSDLGPVTVLNDPSEPARSPLTLQTPGPLSSPGGSGESTPTEGRPGNDSQKEA